MCSVLPYAFVHFTNMQQKAERVQLHDDKDAYTVDSLLREISESLLHSIEW